MIGDGVKLKQVFQRRGREIWQFCHTTVTVFLQVEPVVLLFVDEASTVSEELNQWRAALAEHDQQFHGWKKIWVGVRTTPPRVTTGLTGTVLTQTGPNLRAARIHQTRRLTDC